MHGSLHLLLFLACLCTSRRYIGITMLLLRGSTVHPLLRSSWLDLGAHSPALYSLESPYAVMSALSGLSRLWTVGKRLMGFQHLKLLIQSIWVNLILGYFHACPYLIGLLLHPLFFSGWLGMQDILVSYQLSAVNKAFFYHLCIFILYTNNLKTL